MTRRVLVGMSAGCAVHRHDLCVGFNGYCGCPCHADGAVPSGPAAAWEEEVTGWDGDLVRVSREVPFFDFSDRRERTVEEYAALLVAATVGLTDTRVDGHNYYDSIRVEVTGCRPPTPEESAEREQRERLGWIAAKGIYERGLERFGGSDA